MTLPELRQKLQVVELVILSQNLLILSMNFGYHSTNFKNDEKFIDVRKQMLNTMLVYI